MDSAAAHVATDDPLHPQAVDLLPVEDRYLDDGSVHSSDSTSFGVHSGTTEYMEPLRDVPEPSGRQSLQAMHLIGELKASRRRVFAAIGATAVVIGIALYAF